MLASTAANDQNFHADDSRNDNSSQRRLSNFSSFHLLAPRAQKWFHLAAMPWDFIAILVLLGVFVPWRGAVRIRQLLRQEHLTTTDRLALYASTLAFQWLAAAVVLWRALSRQMALRQLALALPRPWLALGIGAGLATLLLANQLISLRRMAQLPQDQQGLIGQIARKVMPQTTVERLGFLALVITVAICEEFLYRGFIQSIFQQTLAGSSATGAFISAAFFSVAHLYQGKRGLVSTFVMGLIFSAVRILTGSLFPSMLAHLATDLSAGLAAPGLLSKPAAACPPAGPNQSACDR
jgi:membrane protease YdiL (CAAX protease family)